MLISLITHTRAEFSVDQFVLELLRAGPGSRKQPFFLIIGAGFYSLDVTEPTVLKQ